MVFEAEQHCDSQWEAICSVAEKLGPTAGSGKAETRLEGAISKAVKGCDQLEGQLDAARQALRQLSVLTAQEAR